jgi:hypothetical protein
LSPLEGADARGDNPESFATRWHCSPTTSVDDLNDQWEDGTFGSEGAHTIIDVCEVIDAEAFDDAHTVRPLSDEEAMEIFGTTEPTRADLERAHKRYVAGQPGSEELWGMPMWSAWCRPLKEADGVTNAIATPTSPSG